MRLLILFILLFFQMQILSGQNKAGKIFSNLQGQMDELTERIGEMKKNILEAQNAAYADDVRMYCNDIHINAENLYYEFRYLRNYLKDIEDFAKKEKLDELESLTSKTLNKCYLFEPYINDIYNFTDNRIDDADFSRLQGIVSEVWGKYEQMILVFGEINNKIIEVSNQVK